MHGFDDAPPVLDDPNDNRPWYQMLTGYHWFVLGVSALGWLFDCLDQQLFVLARPAAMEELLAHLKSNPEEFTKWSKWAGDISTFVFISGWATGGLIFGMLGDRIGRAKTMMLTILIYSLCTGLSALSVSVYDFWFYRLLTGLGVGGEFAVGVALVAEVMPARARPYTLALLQSLSAVGNISAALIFMALNVTEEEGLGMSPWRIMFCIGALPALLALVIRGRLKEPEQWQAASGGSGAKKPLGSYAELFAHPTWRKHALLGMLLACSGVIGLWAVGFYVPDLTRSVLGPHVRQTVFGEELAAAEKAGDAAQVANLKELQALMEADLKAKTPAEKPKFSEAQTSDKKRIDGKIKASTTIWQGMSSICINVGAALGMFGFGAVAQRIGRKPTFVIAMVSAFIMTATVFWTLRTPTHILVLVPIMGFCQLSLFAGYAIYFPELFPTRLRSTGTSFCYNVGRFIAATGPLARGGLDSFFKSIATAGDPMRLAGVTMSLVLLVGMLALPFLPETKDKPLPED